MSGAGMNDFPIGKLKDGKKAYTISYNGRVWDKEDNLMSQTFEAVEHPNADWLSDPIFQD